MLKEILILPFRLIALTSQMLDGNEPTFLSSTLDIGGFMERRPEGICFFLFLLNHSSSCLLTVLLLNQILNSQTIVSKCGLNLSEPVVLVKRSKIF